VGGLLYQALFIEGGETSCQRRGYSKEKEEAGRSESEGES